jgi:hypothetical protein
MEVSFMHHNNALAPATLSIKNPLTKHNIPLVNNPHYSLDLAPSDAFLFPKLKHLQMVDFREYQRLIEVQQRN